MTSLFTTSDFSGYPTFSPINAGTKGTGGLSIITSDGVTVSVFDTIDTGLKCLRYMISRNQSYLHPNQDITIALCGPKLFILENTLLNQKLMSYYSFEYVGDRVMLKNKTLSSLHTLADALVSVGYKLEPPANFSNNWTLETNITDINKRPNIQFFGFYHQATQANATTGELLIDPTPINYNSEPYVVV